MIFNDKVIFNDKEISVVKSDRGVKYDMVPASFSAGEKGREPFDHLGIMGPE